MPERSNIGPGGRLVVVGSVSDSMFDSFRIRWTISLVAALTCLSCGSAFASNGRGHHGSNGSNAEGGNAPTADAPSRKPGGKVVGGIQPELVRTAQRRPGRKLQVIVQFKAGVSLADARGLLELLGARHPRVVPLINGIGVRMSAKAAAQAGRSPLVRAVSINERVKPQWLVNFDPNKMATAYNQSSNVYNMWNAATGKGVGVAVIDSGIAGDLPDFRVSQSNPASRVIGAAVVNPNATNAGDPYGHGTHVAGIIAGNSGYRPKSDALFGKYAGAAPDANLISVKAGDDNGDATVLDVIYGLQFVVDHKADYNIRVVNLSLESGSSQSYKTDPLDAAVEAAWFNGIVVVTAAGNRGTAGDAVQHAPGNDPYVVTVGGVDDKKTKDNKDDVIATWSSRGTTQDGFQKPDLYAPGAHIVSSLAPGSKFESMCPSCITAGQYIQAGGTSMAAPIVSGAAADILELHPDWTPDMVKGALIHTLRILKNVDGELNGLNALNAKPDKLYSNHGLTPNTMIDPATGQIDYTRSTWSRSTWSTAPDSLSAGWARSTWSCDCSRTSSGSIDPTRSTWSRSTWSTAWDL
jgi:serine protease AprX